MKIILHIALFAATLTQGYAQSLEYTWARQAGGEDTDMGNAIATDPDGNIIVVGTFISDTMFFSSTNLANSDTLSAAMFVAKYSPSGDLLWATNPITPSAYKTTSGTGVATDANGNVFVVGDMSTDSVSFDGNWIVHDNDGGGYYSYSYVAKYDADGNFLWFRKATGGYGTEGVTVDGIGNVLFIGKGPIIAFDGTLTISNDRHFIAKYSNAGDFLWVNATTFSAASSYGFNAEWDNKAVFADADNNVYMAGWSGLDTTFFNAEKTIYVSNNASLRNAFLVKYNSSGVAQWATGASRTEVPNSLTNFTPEGIYASDDAIYLTGWWQGDSLRMDNHPISADFQGSTQNMFVAKFDLSGNNLWVRTLGSEGNDYGRGVTFDSDGNSYVVGTTEGYDLHFGNSPIGTTIGGNHATVFKIGTDGTLLDYLQASNIPPYGTSYGNAIAVDDADNILVAGGFSSSVAFGDDILTATASINWQDMFVCKLLNDFSIGMTAPGAQGHQVSIYPNPASDNIFIDISGADEAQESELEIYSMTGGLVRKASLHGSLMTVSLEGLVDGMYLIALRSIGQGERQRFIIQR
jgi:hypothetical protein